MLRLVISSPRLNGTLYYAQLCLRLYKDSNALQCRIFIDNVHGPFKRFFLSRNNYSKVYALIVSFQQFGCNIVMYRVVQK